MWRFCRSNRPIHSAFFCTAVQQGRRLVLTAGVAMLILCSTAPTHAIEGRDLIDDCKIGVAMVSDPAAVLMGNQFSDADMTRAERCMSFLRGVVQSVRVHQALEFDTLFCVPTAGLNPSQAATALLDWVDGNPDAEGTYGVILVMQAFQARFPCDH